MSAAVARRAARLAWLVLVGSSAPSLVGCAAHARPTPASAPASTPRAQGGPALEPAPLAPAERAAAARALVALEAALRAGDRAALERVGVALRAAGAAVELTGEPASDERVAEARAFAGDDGATAAVLLRTSCGNARVVALRFERAVGAWREAARSVLVEGAAPGACPRTEAALEPLPLSSDARRELAVRWSSQDETGERMVGPALRVLRLEPDGALRELLRDAPFGGADEATGALYEAAVAVLEDAPPPRALFVVVRPSRGGLAGPPLAGRRSQYELRGGELVRVAEGPE